MTQGRTEQERRDERGPGVAGTGDSNSNQAGMAGEMSARIEGAGSAAAGRAEQVAEQAADGVAQAGEKAQEGMEQLRERAAAVEQTGREGAASTMERAAETLREQVPVPGADAAAEGMQQAAGYLQTHTSEQLIDDLEGYVRQHPMPALLTALAAGLVVGRVMR